MLSFSVYIVYMMMYYKHLPCSCGGFLDLLSWPAHLVLNGTFIVLGIIALLLSKRKHHMTKKQAFASTT